MKKLLVLLIGIVFAGCSTVSTKTGPTYLDVQGNPRFDAKVVYADTSMFAPSSSDAVMLDCIAPQPFVATDVDTGKEHVEKINLEDEELLRVSRCEHSHKIAHDSATGVAASFIAPVVNSAAIAYTGYAIGKGIGDSGDQITDNSSVNSDNVQEQEQAQFQDQDQKQEAIARGGAKGPIGLTGSGGAIGPTGPGGAKGATGIQGKPGPKGDAGRNGPRGPRGPRGPKGANP